MGKFSYVTEKILRTDFSEEPFKHLYIENLFNDFDFEQIIRSPQVDFPKMESDEQLIEELYSRSFKEIKFPGTTTDIPLYLQWHKDPTNAKNENIDICEGFGVTFRMQQASEGTFISYVDEYFKSPEFWEAVAEKFQIDLGKVTTDTGLQKYLDGYEISPHPDIRRKALTFMINLNPAENSEEIAYHTSYLTLKPEHQYVKKSWAENLDVDRCWVPWDWCDVVKRQTKNNSMVMFSPANDTMHAVKASYDHLSSQRTQYYGNLWLKYMPSKTPGFWRQFEKDRIKETV